MSILHELHDPKALDRSVLEDPSLIGERRDDIRRGLEARELLAYRSGSSERYHGQYPLCTCVRSSTINGFLTKPEDVIRELGLDPEDFVIRRYLSPKDWRFRQSLISPLGEDDLLTRLSEKEEFPVRQFPIVRIEDRDHKKWLNRFVESVETVGGEHGESSEPGEAPF